MAQLVAHLIWTLSEKTVKNPGSDACVYIIFGSFRSSDLLCTPFKMSQVRVLSSRRKNIELSNKTMKCYYKTIDIKTLRDIVENSDTFAEVMRKLGYTANRGNSIKGLKKHLDENGIDYSKFSKNNILAHSHPKNDLSEILVEDSKYTNMTRLKDRILRAGLLKYECYICNINEWNGKPITLQLDHINGNNRDNRIENLRLLCPNCHSQTETFCGKKKRY